MTERIDPTESHRRMREEAYVYLDVRSPDEFAQGHPEGAYNIPLGFLAGGQMQANPEFLNQALAHFPTDTPIVLGCAAGVRSMHALHLLMSAGYTQLVDNLAGFGGVRDRLSGAVEQPGWADCGLPVATVAEPGRDYASLSGA